MKSRRTLCLNLSLLAELSAFGADNTPPSGFTALFKRVVNISDAYADLSAIHPRLTFNKAVDESHGQRTRNILSLPVTNKGEVIGVFQVVNKKSGAFTAEDERLLRSFAVMVGIVTLPTLEVSPGDIMLSEKGLTGSIGGSSVPARDFPIFCDWVRRGRLDLGSIVTRRFAFDEIASAAAALDRGEITGRAIVVF